MTTRTRTPPRGTLRLADLKQRVPVPTRTMNVRIPGGLAHALDALGAQLNASKTEVVVALLNAGLDVVKREHK